MGGVTTLGHYREFGLPQLWTAASWIEMRTAHRGQCVIRLTSGNARGKHPGKKGLDAVSVLARPKIFVACEQRARAMNLNHATARRVCVNC
jgi:hypothetical protein